MYKTTLAVDGMMCGMCEQHVREAVQKALEERSISAKKITASRKQKECRCLQVHAGGPRGIWTVPGHGRIPKK